MAIIMSNKMQGVEEFVVPAVPRGWQVPLACVPDATTIAVKKYFESACGDVRSQCSSKYPSPRI